MTALKRILVATDFSACSQAAVAQAIALGAMFGATVHLLHVVTEPLNELWACYAPGADFLQTVDALTSQARQQLEELASAQPIPRHQIVVSTAWGHPADEILRYGQTQHVGLIVCGTHGRRGWDGVFLGSVAERVVRLATCPVLTVRATAQKAAAAA